MQTIYNLCFWAIAIPFLIIAAVIVIPIAIGIIIFTILAVSIFAIPVLGSLLLLKKLV